MHGLCCLHAGSWPPPNALFLLDGVLTPLRVTQGLPAWRGRLLAASPDLFEGRHPPMILRSLQKTLGSLCFALYRKDPTIVKSAAQLTTRGLVVVTLLHDVKPDALDHVYTHGLVAHLPQLAALPVAPVEHSDETVEWFVGIVKRNLWHMPRERDLLAHEFFAMQHERGFIARMERRPLPGLRGAPQHEGMDCLLPPCAIACVGPVVLLWRDAIDDGLLTLSVTGGMLLVHMGDEPADRMVPLCACRERECIHADVVAAVDGSDVCSLDGDAFMGFMRRCRPGTVANVESLARAAADDVEQLVVRLAAGARRRQRKHDAALAAAADADAAAAPGAAAAAGAAAGAAAAAAAGADDDAID
eukprot:gene1535-3872_t